MKILSDYSSAELIVKKSRFLGEVFICENQNDARTLIKSQKTKYFDATHVVHAFMLGLKGEVLGMSDDGEPAGTAGRPVLDVVKGRGCTNLVLTVTRWFGGTLLGTGGLVKAYGDCAKAVLDAAEKNGFINEYVETKTVSFNVDYISYQIIKHLMEQYTISELNEDFGESVKVSFKIVASEASLFSEKIKNATNGKIQL